MFKRASFTSKYLKLCLVGLSFSGKTWWALKIAEAFSNKIAVIDADAGEAQLYANEFTFDHLAIEEQGQSQDQLYHPNMFLRPFEEAVKAKYGIVVVDAFHKEWVGDGGCLNTVSRINRENKTHSKNVRAWGVVTPAHDRLHQRLHTAPIHTIVTVNAKDKVSLEKNEKGETVVEQLPYEPLQRGNLKGDWRVYAHIYDDHVLQPVKAKGTFLDPLMERVMEGKKVFLVGREFSHPDDFIPALQAYMAGKPLKPKRKRAA